MENYYENADSKCPFAANTQGDCNLKYVDFFLAICTNEYWRMYSSQVRRFARREIKIICPCLASSDKPDPNMERPG